MLNVKELSTEEIPLILNYWYNASAEELLRMGVVPEKMLARVDFEKILHEHVQLPYHLKGSYCSIWQLDGTAIGHCNVNRIMFKDEANMHLHMWDKTIRKKGMGTALIPLSLALFFKNLELKKVYCEPNAHNIAPNKTLLKAGFTFVKQFIGKPGNFSDDQELNQYMITAEDFFSLQLKKQH